MSSQSDYQPLFSYLRSLNFHFLETWVVECVNYYKSINPNISVEALKNEVKQQWLLVDLREIKVPSLPANLKSKEKIILNGNYAVQVETMIDCSQSCYSQFRRLRNINDEDIMATKDPQDVDDKSRRCLNFGISDGVQELHALEYRPIKKIRTNDPKLLPGFKMVIMGPVECRKGVILLKDENVRLYGGEVDTLIRSNNLKSILLKRLDLDEADFQDDNDPAVDENTQPAQNFDDRNVASLLSENEDLFLSLPLEADIPSQEIQTREIPSRNNQIVNIYDSDLIQSCAARKHNLSAEDVESPSQKKFSLDSELGNSCITSTGNPDSFGINEDFFEDDMEVDFESPQPSISNPKVTKKSVQTELPFFFKNNQFVPESAKTTSCDKRTSVVICGRPFTYIKQIMSFKLSKPTVFTIKGIILTLKKKITIQNNKLSLTATISDGSFCLDVDFASDVLEELLGFSPCEMAVLIKAKQTNSAVAQRIKESFSKVQEKLISLNCLMDVKFGSSSNPPVIVSLKEVTLQHLNKLKERQLKEN